MIGKMILYLLVGTFLTSCGTFIPSNEKEVSETLGYKMITVEELQTAMQEEEFTFVNVHIPSEGIIPETDMEIPYNEVEKYLDQFPADKNEKVVLYCRSGGMGDDAAQTLVNNGYTNVYNLEGGYVKWKAYGLPFEEKAK